MIPRMAAYAALALLMGGCTGGADIPAAASISSEAPRATEAGALEGLVMDPEQRPIQGANVEALNPSLRVNRSAVTGVDGKFAFRDLPVGTYRVFAQAIFFTRMSRDVEVSSGDIATVRFDLVDVVNPSKLFVETHV